MKRLVMLAAFTLSAPAALWAQEDSKVELFGGYSNIQVMESNISGWSASIARKSRKCLGVVADFAGYYQNGGALHSFMFGPRFTYPVNKNVAPFAQFLVGAALANNGSSDSIFTMALGGGLDFRIAPRLALRLPQAEIVMARDDGINTGAFRLGLGVVLKF